MTGSANSVQLHRVVITGTGAVSLPGTAWMCCGRS